MSMTPKSAEHDPIILAVAFSCFGFLYAPMALEAAKFIVYRVWGVK